MIIGKIKACTRPYLVDQISLKDLKIDLDPLWPGEKINTSETLNMPFFELAQSLKKEIYLTPPIAAKILPKILYDPQSNLLFTQSKKIIIDSSGTVRAKDKLSQRINLKNLYFQKPEVVEGFSTVFRSFGTEGSHYHILIDNLPRFYPLHHQKYQKIKEIQILYSQELNQVENFFLEKLLPDNARMVKVDKKKFYLTEKFIFSDFLTRRFFGFLPSIYLDFFVDKVKPNRSRNKQNRIFISRVTSGTRSGRCIENEECLFNRLEKYGFKKYILESLSIEDQINIFYDAEFVIGTHGAGLTNIIFSEKIKVLELFPMPFIKPNYYYLSKSLGHSYLYWCGDQQSLVSNFSINVTEIEEIIKNNL
ncbi:MAG: glycosyltransferase family 61 protein [Cyanobacteria bacterium J06592_8]